MKDSVRTHMHSANESIVIAKTTAIVLGTVILVIAFVATAGYILKVSYRIHLPFFVHASNKTSFTILSFCESDMIGWKWWGSAKNNWMFLATFGSEKWDGWTWTWIRNNVSSKFGHSTIAAWSCSTTTCTSAPYAPTDAQYLLWIRLVCLVVRFFNGCINLYP